MAAKTEKVKQVEQTEEKKPRRQDDEPMETLIRVYGYDIPGSRKIFAGLTRIKGVSWAISNAVCLKLNIPKTKKISDLTKEEIKEIETELKTLDGVPAFMKNRRSDPETGEEKHLYTNDLDMQKDFDIKRLRKMKSYRGIRHASKLPVRGQRTRANFRAKGKAVGVRRKK